ncbi:MAG TPA: molybdenum cofactor biosynthesis protein MoaE [Drouetiella sp.]
MFTISDTSIDADDLRRQFANDRAGAFVTFEGWVRNHNEGKDVLTLEYEAYEQLCLNEAEAILHEAKQRFSILDATCVHRTGALAIGEMAVWVGVSAAHRGAAFDACRYIIDEIKLRLPIWKKETYVNGSSGWVNCQNCASHSSNHSHDQSAKIRKGDAAAPVHQVGSK